MKSLLIAATFIIAAAPAAMAEGDAAKGKKAFRLCKACHKLEAGKHGVGPSLHGVIGASAGAADGYKYSPAMKKSGLTWDDATLDAYLKNPRKTVKGTKMSFAGVKKDAQRADLIAYLKEATK